MANFFELKAFVDDGGEIKPFPIVISRPDKSVDAEDYFCCVHIPGLFKKDKNIHGVDAGQAEELSMNFVRNMLSGKNLTDKEGNPINLASW